MIKLRLGMIVGVLAIALTLLSCSPYEYQATSVEHLRELIAEASAKSNAVEPAPSQPNTPVSTKPSSYSQPSDQAPSEYDRDYLGYLPSEYYGDLTEPEKRGLQTWYFWTGGNEKFFRDLAKRTQGEADFLSLIVSLQGLRIHPELPPITSIIPMLLTPSLTWQIDLEL